MSEDLIKRSDAIKALNREKSDWNCDYNVPIDNCIKRLKKVKSADRPQGEWIDNGGRYFRCSLCGAKDTDKWLWCHGCGVKMKGVSDAV